jgi:hypothetical protein
MTRNDTPLGPWEPAPPHEVVAIFAGFIGPWWIAGGYAIELAVGHRIRDHADIDVVVLRSDQLFVQQVLVGWDLFAADPPGTLRPWRPLETLPASVQDVWCRPNPASPWRIQVMLDEAEGGEWIFRRDPVVHRNLALIGAVTDDGIPYLAPEIQLLYKAERARLKDETDFVAVLPFLAPAQRAWLNEAIRICHGDEHPWLSRLGG